MFLMQSFYFRKSGAAHVDAYAFQEGSNVTYVWRRVEGGDWQQPRFRIMLTALCRYCSFKNWEPIEPEQAPDRAMLMQIRDWGANYGNEWFYNEAVHSRFEQLLPRSTVPAWSYDG